jgi:predicted nucleic acid-binding protein
MTVSQFSQGSSQAAQLRICFALTCVLLLAMSLLFPARLLELAWLDLQFRLLRPGADAAVALAEAQRALRAAGGPKLSRAHPFFWAPFVFVGD